MVLLYDTLSITSEKDYVKSLVKLGDALNFVAAELAKIGSDFGQEAAYIINLDRHQVPIRTRIIALGTYCSVPLVPGEIVKAALKDNADSIMLIHNHPAGELAPSQEDIAQTQKIIDACDLCGTTLVDHIIMSNDSVHNYKIYSFKKKGVVELGRYAKSYENMSIDDVKFGSDAQIKNMPKNKGRI